MDPVIIVGAGPVGLTLALALARQEVPSVVLDEGPGKDEPRPARTVVLREDTAALMERLTGIPLAHAGFRWAGWRSMRRKQVTSEIAFEDAGAAPLHIAQHVLTGALRAALDSERLVRIAVDSRLDTMEQERSGITAHTRGATGTWWRGSYLVGCDGPRSTVRKLQDIRFPGRTAVERHAVAALRTELPWQDEALLHRAPPWRTSGPSAGRSPPARCRTGCGGWTGCCLRARTWSPRDAAGPHPGDPGRLERRLDPAVRAAGHRGSHRPPPARPALAGPPRLPRRGRGAPARRAGHARAGRGLRDADNLAWKLALAWHHGPHEALLDSYQTERRAIVASRLRAADQALPLLRGGGDCAPTSPAPRAATTRS